MVAQKMSLVVMQTVGTIFKSVISKKKQLIQGLIIVVIGGALFFLHHMWSGYRNEVAQRDLGTLMDFYTTAMSEKNPDFEALLEQFQAGYEKNASSDAAPYFLAYQTDILVQQDKREEAVALLDTIISQLHSSSLASFYKMKRALMMLDSSDEAGQKKGKAELEALAYDKKNSCNDSALFYLGRYYWSMDEIASARHAWQTLLDEQSGSLVPSPWVDLAKRYLSVAVL